MRMRSALSPPASDTNPTQPPSQSLVGAITVKGLSSAHSVRRKDASLHQWIMPLTIRALGVFGLGVLACGRGGLSNTGPTANGVATVLDARSSSPSRADASTGGVDSLMWDDTSGGSRPCVVQNGGGWGTGQAATCADLDVLAVSDPVILDQGGDGKLSAGEDATLRVNLNEVSGIGFSWYPGVNFASDDASVSIKAYDWFYAIAACTSYETRATIHVAPGATPGSIVHITAQVAMINVDCPHAPSLVIPVMLE